MNASKLIAALTIFAAAGAALAAEAAVADAAAAAKTDAKPLLLASAATEAAVSSVNFPTARAKPAAARSRAEVQAEAVDAVKNHQSTLSRQLELGM